MNFQAPKPVTWQTLCGHTNSRQWRSIDLVKIEHFLNVFGCVSNKSYKSHQRCLVITCPVISLLSLGFLGSHQSHIDTICEFVASILFLNVHQMSLSFTPCSLSTKAMWMTDDILWCLNWERRQHALHWLEQFRAPAWRNEVRQSARKCLWFEFLSLLLLQLPGCLALLGDVPTAVFFCGLQLVGFLQDLLEENVQVQSVIALQAATPTKVFAQDVSTVRTLCCCCCCLMCSTETQRNSTLWLVASAYTSLEAGKISLTF